MTLIGSTQTITYGTSPTALTLSLSGNNFVPTSGDGHLPQLGYDRRNNDEQRLKLSRSAMGSPVLSAPVYRTFQLLEFNLKLSEPQLLTLWAIVERQQIEHIPAILNDRRLAMLEPTPRKRAKIGSVSGVTAPPGTVIFWPRLAVLLELKEDWSILYNCAQTEGSAIVRLSGKETIFLDPAEYDLP